MIDVMSAQGLRCYVFISTMLYR